jgi:hypothetical protein
MLAVSWLAILVLASCAAAIRVPVNATFTLSQALRHLESIDEPHDDIHFDLATGLHRLSQPLHITSMHSFAHRQVFWHGQPNTIVTTAFQVPPFTLVDAVHNVWQARLPANLSAFTDLYRNTTALTRARTPNAGSYFTWKQPYCPDFQRNNTCAQLDRYHLVYRNEDVNASVRHPLL